MRQEIRNKDCSLAGASDLTVIAPIRKGFVPGLDAVTYKTRAQKVLKALHTGRSGLHEFELARMLSDAVERVGRIHSVRIAVLEPHDQVLLAVTFDGAWESYVRVIWQKVARLLDLIFCNTEGYVNGWDASFEDWGNWLRWRQAETSFLYAQPGVTVDDTVYLRMQERLARASGAAELQATRIATPSAEDIAEGLYQRGQDPSTLPQGRALDKLFEAQPAVFRQGLRSLAGLYRLADMYAPGSADGEVLLRAAQELLPDFSRLVTGDDPLGVGWERAQSRFKEPLRWFIQARPAPIARQPSRPPAVAQLPDAAQGGILESYPDVDYGVVLLVAFDSPAAARDLLQAMPPTLRVDQAGLQSGDLTYNLAFSIEGLRAAGLSDAEVESFPTEFVLGMERRASVLGDLRLNHPRRWRLPADNWARGAAAPDAADDAAGDRVPLQAVHALLHLRRVRVVPAQAPAQGRAPLQAALDVILKKAPGVRPLSVQWLHRLHDNQGTGNQILEHFGFRDGGTDPVFDKGAAGTAYANHVHTGEALVGYPNAGDVAAPQWPAASAWTRGLVKDGSFLAVRKLRQDLEVLDQVLQTAQADSGLAGDAVLARMMGRWPHASATPGEPLVPVNGSNGPNDFNFDADGEGQKCPMHAHIRRANPRAADASQPAGSRAPRLFRRSMSYGPALDPQDPAAGPRAERGLFFMAYNASLAEQFEVVQRWMSGGNSAKGYSGQSDPFVGVPEPGQLRRFRFEDVDAAGHPRTVRVTLDGDRDLLAEPKQLVRLEWGGYFFAPSFEGLRRLAERAAEAAQATTTEPLPWSVDVGEKAIEALQRLELAEGAEVAAREWKAALEDPQAAADFKTASIWAAIRQRPAGALRTPYGLLVAKREGVDEVLRNPQALLTSTAYLPRMHQSFGTIYLGMDPGQEDQRYEKESADCNRAIRALAGTPADYAKVFDEARRVVTDKLQALVADARLYAQQDETFRRSVSAPPRARLSWELTIDVRELIDELLASFCEQWFGLDSSCPALEKSGFRWTWAEGDPACYPGHFMAPSRYIFQPHPEPQVEAVGIAHGQSMRDAMEELLRTAPARAEAAPVSAAVLGAFKNPQDLPLVARILVGAMMGMVPTVDANLRRVMDRWLAEGTLWALRDQLSGQPAAAGAQLVQEAFRQAMQSRVAPDTLWRTAQRGHQLGKASTCPVQVNPGDVIVAGLGSAAQEAMEQGRKGEVAAAFGATTAGPQPTHACPGYQPALAMMEGFAAAVAGFHLPLQPGPGPLTFVMTGYEAYVPPAGPAPAPAAAAAVPYKMGTPDLVGFAAGRRASRGTLWVYGDSWLAAPVPGRSTLSGALQDMGYDVRTDFASTGRKLASMAAEVEDPRADILTRLQSAATVIDALIVGGGGNDVTNRYDPRTSMLFQLLVKGASTAQQALDAAQMTTFIDETLKTHLHAVLTAVVQATAARGTPILVHAYGNPVADGRQPTFLGVPAGPAWLYPVFRLKAITDKDLATQVMRILIGRLNTMAQTVVQSFALPRLQYVDLRGKLVEQWVDNGPYLADWADELHPSVSGFAKLGQELAAKLPVVAPIGPVPLR